MKLKCSKVIVDNRFIAITRKKSIMFRKLFNILTTLRYEYLIIKESIDSPLSKTELRIKYVKL